MWFSFLSSFILCLSFLIYFSFSIIFAIFQALKTPVNSALKSSHEVEVVGEVKFSEKCKIADKIYNDSFKFQDSGLNVASSSRGKLPPYGPKRIFCPSKYNDSPYDFTKSRSVISSNDLKYMILLFIFHSAKNPNSMVFSALTISCLLIQLCFFLHVNFIFFFVHASTIAMTMEK